VNGEFGNDKVRFKVFSWLSVGIQKKACMWRKIWFVGTETKWSMPVWNQRRVAHVVRTRLGLLAHGLCVMLQGIVNG